MPTHLARKAFPLLPAALPAVTHCSAAIWWLSCSTSHVRGVALRGFNAVAGPTERQPVGGMHAFRAELSGIAWHFASAVHTAQFEADPAAHSPRYDAFCACGVAQGHEVDFDPKAWHSGGGKLYFRRNLGVQRECMRDIPGHISGADANWLCLAESRGV